MASWPLEESVFRACYGGDAPSSAVLTAMTVITIVGGGWAVVGMGPLLLPKRTRMFTITLLVTLLVAGTIVQVAKRVFRRPRPCNALDGVHALHGKLTDFSFPSGHAAGCFAFAGFIITVLLTKRADGSSPQTAHYLGAALSLCVACAVAFSRLYLGAHWPLDVFGGAVIGFTVGIVGARIYLGLRAKQGRPKT